MATDKADANLTSLARRDTLSNEVSIRANIDQTGLTVAGKSRALAAADRLLGGVIGIPAAYFEGVRARMEARNEIREDLIRADGMAAAAILDELSDVGKLAMTRFVRDEIRRQDNRAAIWVATEDQLRLSPPQSDHPDSTQPDADTNDNPEIDDGWFNIFTRYAEQVSSERLQVLWGRILAGEIRKPGSFGPTTLRVIAEMDGEVARTFQAVYRHSVGAYVLRPAHVEGELLERFSFLEQVGLVQADAMLQIKMPQQSDGWGYLLGSQYLIRATFSPNTTVIQIPVFRITRVGLQVGTILPHDELAALREIASSLNSVTKVELCKIKSHAKGRIEWELVEVIPVSKPDAAV